MEDVNFYKEKPIHTQTSLYFSKSGSEFIKPILTSNGDKESKINDTSCKELMLNQEEFKLYFGTENILNAPEINFGPKIYLDTFTKCQFNQSLENIEENSIIDILEYGRDSPELPSQSITEEEASEKTESKKEIPPPEEKENSKFSFHINNTANRMKFPPRINMNNILHTSYNNENEINTNHRSNNMSTSRVEKQGCIGCFATKKVPKLGNATTFPMYNNPVANYTKRSTNISIKSLKLNDSIQKHRRRRSQLSIATDDLNSSKKQAEKPTSCRCMIF